MGWDGMEWDEMRWDGMGWTGVGWGGMGWAGMEWDGLEWGGVGWDGKCPATVLDSISSASYHLHRQIYVMLLHIHLTFLQS